METLGALLDKASLSLGVAVDNVYAVVLQQAKVELVKDIAFLIVLYIALGVCFRLAKWRFDIARKQEDSWSADDYSFQGHLLLWVPAVITTVSTLTVGGEIIQILVNPPMWVIEYLMKMVGNM